MHSGPAEVLRDARLRQPLTQQELADKLGLRQRQISDLERARTDPRLSTVQNVARALDLDVVLVPRHLISAVQALIRAGREAEQRPMYALEGDESEDAPGEAQ
jgi:transcriptional regulator with XRE-family HTH domain